MPENAPSVNDERIVPYPPYEDPLEPVDDHADMLEHQDFLADKAPAIDLWETSL